MSENSASVSATFVHAEEIATSAPLSCSCLTSRRTIGGSKKGVSVMALAYRGSILVHALLNRASTPVNSRMMPNRSW
jgi:hypothetical protein